MTQDPTNGLSARVEARKQTPTGNALNVQIGPGDPISNVPVVMEFEHHQIHEGETFRAQSAQASLATGTVKYGITVGAYSPTVRAPHMVLACSVYNGSAKVLLYEGATFTSGAGITAYNRNRNVLTAAAATITGGVTSTDGTLIETFYVGTGSKTAGTFRADSEWVLKASTIYRVDLIGLAAGTEAVLSFNWYEDLGV